MHAVRFHEFGGAEVLRHEDVDVPVPGRGEVRLRVAGTSFNDLDAALRSGTLPGVRLPHTPGVDVAGTVDALGPGRARFPVGAAVVGLLPSAAPGAAAQFVLAGADDLTGAPRQVPLADVAALPLVGLTAWQAVVDHGRLRPGERVLVHGAGSAVGHYAVQLAREVSADVVLAGTATAASVDLALVLAPLPGDRTQALLAAVRDGGRIVSTAGPAPRDPTRGIRGVDVVVRRDTDQLADLVARVCTRELRLHVAERVPLVDLPAVHARAAVAGLPGKVVVLAPTA
ncbi:NADP-dependent oxidoreductase [Kineococcus sp. TBRC 1896]|uniref:NADP-dependent oxidoreductase n=1 Tax=Kineococcus mangrovi TaxID=1660183 RepID=A0ABV4HYL4_9ACTN